jgi:hypothetical protein
MTGMSLLKRLRAWWWTRDCPNPERFWNRMSVQERQTVLEKEGMEGVDAARRWFDLSITERAFLLNVLSVIQITLVTEKLAKSLPKSRPGGV